MLQIALISKIENKLLQHLPAKAIDTIGKMMAPLVVTILPFSNSISAELTAMAAYFSIMQFSKFIDDREKSRYMEKTISHKNLVKFTLLSYSSTLASYNVVDFDEKKQ